MQAGQIGGECAAIGSDEHAAFAEHRVSREARPVADQREVIGSVSGRGERLKGPKASPFGELHVDLATSACKRRRSAFEQSVEHL